MAPLSPTQLTISHEPLVLHGQIEVARPPAIVLVSATDYTRARMDRQEQRFRQIRVFDGVTSWDDFDGAPTSGLRPSFRMLETKRYIGRGCSRFHLRLYTIAMRAHKLDETRMLMLFPMLLSGVTQSW